MSSFRRMIVPNDITPKFLQVAQRNTGMNTSTTHINTYFYRIIRASHRNMWYSRWYSSKSNEIIRLIISPLICLPERCLLCHHAYHRTQTEWWSW